jgi:hypothetical protein
MKTFNLKATMAPKAPKAMKKATKKKAAATVASKAMKAMKKAKKAKAADPTPDPMAAPMGSCPAPMAAPMGSCPMADGALRKSGDPVEWIEGQWWHAMKRTFWRGWGDRLTAFQPWNVNGWTYIGPLCRCWHWVELQDETGHHWQFTVLTPEAAQAMKEEMMKKAASTATHIYRRSRICKKKAMKAMKGTKKQRRAIKRLKKATRVLNAMHTKAMKAMKAMK